MEYHRRRKGSSLAGRWQALGSELVRTLEPGRVLVVLGRFAVRKFALGTVATLAPLAAAPVGTVAVADTAGNLVPVAACFRLILSGRR